MIKERIQKLQNSLETKKIDYYYLDTSDFHLSEYVAPYFKDINYFLGFSGSLAQAIISKDEAHIFVDGRYHLQATNQCEKNGVIVEKLGLKGVIDSASYLKEKGKKSVIGLDGRRTSIKFVEKLLEAHLNIKSLDLYSELVENRIPLKKDKIREIDIKYVGKTRKEKLDEVYFRLSGNVHIINNCEAIAYLLNLRGNDTPHTPSFLSYLIIDNNQTYLFIDQERLTKDLYHKLTLDGVIVKPYLEYYEFLKTIKNKMIFLDKNKVNYETYQLIKDDNRVIDSLSMVDEMKAVKNEIEIENIRKAHIKDGVAMVKFLYWLKQVDVRRFTEYDVAKKLDEIRIKNGAFDVSFDSIVAYQENASIIHYSPSKENAAKLNNSGILLVDSGGQYEEGTTDITRTICLGDTDDEIKKYFTIVLSSMFALANFKFISGISGNQLDIIARNKIWEYGLDYRHGTGHGVGHVLAVHEGPMNVRYMHTDNMSEKYPIKPGAYFSDEPGLYFDNQFGIRCENLLLCKKDLENEYGQFLSFETMTLCPFDLRLIDSRYLTDEVRKQLNEYHKYVYDKLSPYLSASESAFLKEETRSI